MIDFILHTDDLQTQSVLQPLSSAHALRVAQRQSLPNQVHPSDHLPVGAVLVGRVAQGLEDDAAMAQAGGADGRDGAARVDTGHMDMVHVVGRVAQPRCVCGATTTC